MTPRLNEHFREEQIEWKPIPPEWDQTGINPAERIASGRPVYIFRSHKFHRPEYGADKKEIIYAAPNPVLNPQRLNAQKIYDLPERAHFITVYRANPGQRFFHDDKLETASHTEGTAIESITKFDPVAHFETNAAGCDVEGIYLVVLPKDPASALSISVNRETARVLRIDDRKKLMAILDEIVVPAHEDNADNKPKPLREV